MHGQSSFPGRPALTRTFGGRFERRRGESVGRACRSKVDAALRLIVHPLGLVVPNRLPKQGQTPLDFAQKRNEADRKEYGLAPIHQ